MSSPEPRAEPELRHSALRGALFADIADSSRLYRELGDGPARDVVLRALDLVRGIVQAHEGRVVDRIGDELFCIFEGIGATVQAALDAQEAVVHAAEQGVLPPFLRMRIGFHHGPVVLDGERVFGDTVYLAKRVASLAKAQQVLTTEETLNAYGLDEIEARFVETTMLKGRSRPTRVYELLFGAEATVMIDDKPSSGIHSYCHLPAVLELAAGDEVLHIEAGKPTVTMGRDASCDLVIQLPVVSRVHGRVELRKRGFFFIDLSTNGSCVAAEGGKPRYVHRDELRLEDKGTLILGPRRGPDVPEVNYGVVPPS